MTSMCHGNCREGQRFTSNLCDPRHISGTFARHVDTASLYKIPDYSAYFACRNGVGGGLCVYVRNEHKLIEINDGNDFFSILLEL